MRHSGAAFLLGLALAAAGCGGKKSRSIPKLSWSAPAGMRRSPRRQQLAGAVQVKGTGWMAGREGGHDQDAAFVSIQNAVPGGEHPWHVHIGQCGNDRGIFGAADAYEPLRVGSNGQAQESGGAAGARSDIGTVLHQRPRVPQQHGDHHRLREPRTAESLRRSASGAPLHRRVVTAAPLGPGTVVQGNLPVAKQVQRVDERAGAHAGAARRDDGSVGIHAGRARCAGAARQGAAAYRRPRPAPCTAGSGFRGCARPAGRVGAPARCLRTGPRIAYPRSAPPARPRIPRTDAEITDDSRRDTRAG